MKDPYKVLGVEPSATDEQIKDAYRALVKKYHPDKFADSDLAELANEKMKEVNAAYDEIQKMRSGGNQNRNARSGGYNPGSSSSSEFYARVRQLINMGNIYEAEQILHTTPQETRNAEWNYLYACVLIKKGQYVDAQRFLDIACSMDPYNQEYRNAKEQLHRQANGYGGNYAPQQNIGCSCCDICAGLMCLDCLCGCCR